MTLLPLHILAGSIGIVTGAALYALKGGQVHRRSGTLFVYSMLVMSSSAAVLAALKPNTTDLLQGVLTFYLVLTGMLTVQQRSERFRWIDVAAMLVALAVGVTHVTFGFEALNGATGRKNGYEAPLYFIFGPLALMAAAGDVRAMIATRVDATRRLARHLWRMTFALFIATASFFLGQAQVFPKPIRIMPLLAILGLLPLILMFSWLARLWLRRRRPEIPGIGGALVRH